MVEEARSAMLDPEVFCPESGFFAAASPVTCADDNAAERRSTSVHEPLENDLIPCLGLRRNPIETEN